MTRQAPIEELASPAERTVANLSGLVPGPSVQLQVAACQVVTLNLYKCRRENRKVLVVDSRHSESIF
jgi:hypothetical protein